jgi:hypothetical protein
MRACTHLICTLLQELAPAGTVAEAAAGITNDDNISAVDQNKTTAAESSEAALLRKCAAVASAAVDALQCGKPVLQQIEHGDLPPHSTVDHVITFTPNRVGTVTQVRLLVYVVKLCTAAVLVCQYFYNAVLLHNVNSVVCYCCLCIQCTCM